MADQDLEELEDVELVETAEDNARDLTSGLVITTFVMSLLAMVFMLMALGKWYAVGPFKG